MFQSINTFGHKASAFAGSLIHTREQGMVKARALALGAVFGGIFLVSTSNIAMAQQTLETYSRDVSKNTNVVVDIVSYVCYLGGAILSALGIVDLKKHVENPTGTPLKNGLAKLGFGGILLGLPFVSGVMLSTMKGSGQADYTGFSRSSMTIK